MSRNFQPKAAYKKQKEQDALRGTWIKFQKKVQWRERKITKIIVNKGTTASTNITLTDGKAVIAIEHKLTNEVNKYYKNIVEKSGGGLNQSNKSISKQLRASNRKHNRVIQNHPIILEINDIFSSENINSKFVTQEISKLKKLLNKTDIKKQLV